MLSRVALQSDTCQSLGLGFRVYGLGLRVLIVISPVTLILIHRSSRACRAWPLFSDRSLICLDLNEAVSDKYGTRT